MEAFRFGQTTARDIEMLGICTCLRFDLLIALYQYSGSIRELPVAWSGGLKSNVFGGQFAGELY